MMKHGGWPRVFDGPVCSRHAGRAVAQRQECRDWPIPAEPAAEEFGGQQELGERASEGEGTSRLTSIERHKATGEIEQPVSST